MESQNISVDTGLGHSGITEFVPRIVKDNDYVNEPVVVKHDPDLPKRPKKVKDKAQIVLTGWC